MTRRFSAVVKAAIIIRNENTSMNQIQDYIKALSYMELFPVNYRSLLVVLEL